jgi:glycosyltransferase involved in cell wall biosynthesis
MKNPMYVFDAASALRPDVILMQLHDARTFTIQMMRDLRKENPNAIFINWNGDYFPEIFLNPEYMRLMQMFDLATFVTLDVQDAYDAAGIKWAYWQIGYEKPLSVQPYTLPKIYDVVFLGNSHYHFRNRLAEVLRGMQDIKFGLYGKWPASYRPDGENLYDFDAGHRLYLSSKITISDGRPSHYDVRKQARWVSNRLYQAMYAGCFVLQQRFDGIEEMLGFKDGVDFVLYDDTEKLPDIIRYWLANDEVRMKIADNGRRKCTRDDSFVRRVQQLTAMIEELKHGKNK